MNLGKTLLRIGVSIAILCYQFGLPRERLWHWLCWDVFGGPRQTNAMALPIINAIWTYTLIGIFELIYKLKIKWFEDQRAYPAGKPWPWEDTDPKVRQDFAQLQRKTFINLTLQMIIVSSIGIRALWNVEPNLDKILPEKIPSPWIVGIQLLTITIANTFFIYWAHRAFHYFSWLRKYHDQHHEYLQPTIMSAPNVATIEGLAAAVAIEFLCWLLDVHLYVKIVYLILLHLDGDAVGHSGYDLDFWILPFDWGVPGPVHDVHHRTSRRHNFGTGFKYWDPLFGTYMAPLPTNQDVCKQE